MQKEIKKRAKIYGTVAVISAIVLGALCYNFGVIPTEFQLPPYSAPLRTFSSYEELVNFLLAYSQTQGHFEFYGTLDTTFRGLATPAYTLTVGWVSSLEYSTTNIQVAGVDEADIVKTDGEHIFLVSGGDVWILLAYPPQEAEVLNKITFSNDTCPAGIFVKQDKLAVLGSKYTLPSTSNYGLYYGDVRTFVNIYDVSDAKDPVLLRNFTISGSYFNSRMIGDYIYTVTSQAAYVINNDTVSIPIIYSNEGTKEVSPSEIHYSNVSDSYFSFTTIAALNMQNPAEKPNHKTVMTGGASKMYVSLQNIYITFPESHVGTAIHRVRIDNSNINIEANGLVPGSVLNQFSMDEYNDYFRVATTKWAIEKWTFGTQTNNVYILNMNMHIVGKLENLASGEYLHSARFMGDRGYLVTFKKTDPLFVIDLSQPTNPSILGELKIPGYSDYLHPYDETHLIGVGKHTVEADEGDFAWYQGVKISLFDVSDVTNPKQMANYTIGDRGTDSPILSDHKAFLFDKSKALLVIPVLVAEIEASQYPDGVPSNAYGNPVWQGAYVFSISLEEGFVLKGGITHFESGESVLNTAHWVKRALYIENVLYTVSSKKIKMNSLETLVPINEIEFP